MSYIACPICGGGVPGMPCRCGTSATPFDPQPRPPATLPPTSWEVELLRRIEELEAVVDSAVAAERKACARIISERAGCEKWVITEYRTDTVAERDARIRREAAFLIKGIVEDCITECAQDGDYRFEHDEFERRFYAALEEQEKDDD